MSVWIELFAMLYMVFWKVGLVYEKRILVEKA